jgi:hypothetical protein
MFDVRNVDTLQTSLNCIHFYGVGDSFTLARMVHLIIYVI